MWKMDMNTTTGARCDHRCRYCSAHADAEAPSQQDPPRGVRQARSHPCGRSSCSRQLAAGSTCAAPARTTLARVTAEAAVPFGLGGASDIRIATPTIWCFPGNVQAFTETPIYSRTNGYLKKWYFDIGAHVRKGQFLAEIETPEIDQQLNQSRAELERMQANAAAWLASPAIAGRRCWPSTPFQQQEADQTRATTSPRRPPSMRARPMCAVSSSCRATNASLRPFDGVITARNTDVGDLIDAGSGSSNPRELFHLDATERCASMSRCLKWTPTRFMTATARPLTQDSNPDLKIRGTIVRNADAIDHATRTLNVEVDIDNSKAFCVRAPMSSSTSICPRLAIRLPSPRTRCSSAPRACASGVVQGRPRPACTCHHRARFRQFRRNHFRSDASDEVILDPSDSLASGSSECIRGCERRREVDESRIVPVAAVLFVTAGLCLGRSRAAASGRNMYAHPPRLRRSSKNRCPTTSNPKTDWKPAQPSDAKLKGDWWTLFNDPQLNALEAQIDPANQTLKEAEANFPSRARRRSLQSCV